MESIWPFFLFRGSPELWQLTRNLPIAKDQTSWQAGPSESGMEQKVDVKNNSGEAFLESNDRYQQIGVKYIDSK